MLGFLSLYLQLMLFSILPLLCFGLVMWLCVRLFSYLLGPYSGRRVQTFFFAFAAPVRTAGQVVASVFFWHRIEAVRFLRLRPSDGRLGFVEHSFDRRNPLALLGNLVYALAPALLGLALALSVFLICFEGVIPDFFDRLAALSQDGSFADYARAAWELLPAMFSGMKGHVFAKLIGACLLVLLSTGAFVCFEELAQALSGILWYAGIVFVGSGVLALLDARAQRVVLSGFRAFATGVTALYLPLLLAMAALLCFAAIFWLIRRLFALPEPQTALTPYRGE